MAMLEVLSKAMIAELASQTLPSKPGYRQTVRLI
jgi:hypothetical protein